jgi:Cu+-exporting ATPase
MSTYICPMDAEVSQETPGTCPICGMSLELKITSSSLATDLPQENAELKDFTRRFILALPISIALMAITNFSSHLTVLTPRNQQWLSLALCTPVIIWSGAHFFHRGWISVKTQNPNMWTLISIGTGMAFTYSVMATAAPSIFPTAFRVSGAIPTYFDAAATIIALTLLGQMLELRARAQTSDAIRLLMKLTPKAAHRIDANGLESDVALDSIAINEILRVKPGESIPTDGVLIEGSANVDEAMITGEALPVFKSVGSNVIGSTLNTDGSFLMRVSKIGSDTVLAQIIDLVALAQGSKAPMQKMADRVAKYFVLSVLGIAALTVLIWSSFGPTPRFEYGFINAVAVLIIACPCALGLATPMSVMVASGRAATSGILFRNAEAIEKLDRVDLLIMDKTGTITRGQPVIREVIATGSYDPRSIVQYVASLEISSAHPLAAATSAEARSQNIPLLAVLDFQSITGKGVIGKIAESEVIAGNRALMQNLSVEIDAVGAERIEGSSAIFLAIDGKLEGVITFQDQLKATAVDSIKALQRQGLRVVMASGDHQLAAVSIAKSVGIQEVFGDCTPERKLELIKELQGQGRVVAMVGDGINDAPALTQADIGIAMGNGSDIAVASGEVTLVKGDLLGILRARAISSSTVKNMKENLFFAFAYNVVGIPIAAGALYPITHSFISPAVAALAMSLSSTSVVFNALRLRKK